MRDMEQIVADASVIIKFFVNEIHSSKAQALRDAFISNRINLVEPSLLFYEVINGIKYSKAKKFSVQELKLISKALENYSFDTLELGETLSEKSIEISEKHNLTFYDAVYVASAIISGAILYTADERLIRNAGLPNVKHIKDFK